jgi:hypothetical protein
MTFQIIRGTERAQSQDPPALTSRIESLILQGEDGFNGEML